MKLIEKYNYTPMQRVTQASGARHYICPSTGQHLASVTTILDKTADKTGLLEWRKRMGDHKADEIIREATGLGTLMHKHLECFIASEPRPTGNNMVRKQAERMADQIIKHGFGGISEVYGSEVALYAPGLYAGTADLTCLYKDRLSIIDFKSARKMKKREHINSYLLQIAAYALAHNELYDTNISTGVILMVDRECNFQEFILEKDDFHAKLDEWLTLLEKYLANV